MVPAIASPRNDGEDARDLALSWSGQISLTQRILLVNLLALALLAAGFFYLDSYRSRIVDSRIEQATREARLWRRRSVPALRRGRTALVQRLARDTGARLRLLGPAGVTVDSRSLGIRNFTLQDPDREGWDQRMARFLDGVIDTVVSRSGRPSIAIVPIRPTGQKFAPRAPAASPPPSGARPTGRR